MAKRVMILLLSLLLWGCSAQNTQTQIDPVINETNIPEQALAVPNSGSLVIDQFTTEVGSLCPGKQTQILFSVSGPNDESIEIQFETDYGEVLQDGEDFIYQAPTTKSEGVFDTLTLIASYEENSVKKSIPIMLVTRESVQEWISTGGPEGGIIQTIEIDPNNPDVLYAGGAGGRLIKTADGGENWELLPEFVESTLRIEEILLNPVDTNILYIRADRIFKSEDGGMTYFETTREGGFSSLDINPDIPDQLLAGKWDGKVFLTENGGQSWQQLPLNIPANSSISAVAIASDTEFWAGTREWELDKENLGILYHSLDGGDSWDVVENVNFVPESAVRSIMVPPSEPNTVYVGLMDINNEPWDLMNDRYFLKSTDHGQTWERIVAGWEGLWVGVVDLFDQYQWDDTVYASGGGLILFKSTDDGENFDPFWVPNGTGDIMDMAVDPRDPDVIYLPANGYGILKSINGGESWDWKNQGINLIGLTLLETDQNAATGIVLGASVGGEGEFISHDYGTSWTRVSGEEITHSFGDELKINPHRPNEYWYVADIAEIFISEDEGLTWEKTVSPRLGSFGFRFGSVYGIAVAPSNAKVIYAEKNGFGLYRTAQYEGSEANWGFLHQSDIDYSLVLEVHPEDENIIYAGSIPKPFEDFAMIRKTYDGGGGWETVLSVPNSAGITAITFAGSSSESMYAASTGVAPKLFKSEDSGNSWNQIPFPFSLDEIGTESVDYIEIVPYPGEEEVFFISAYPGGIYFTADSGGNWANISGDLPEFTVEDGLRQGRYNFQLDNVDGDVFYVALYNEGVYKTTNWGEWTLLGPETQDLGILSFVVDPADHNTLYLGTREGMFRSEDGGSTWLIFENGQHFSDTDVRSLAFGPDGTLYAGTLGYEIFALFPGEDNWVQMNSFDNFGTFWPMWDGRPLYQYTFLAFHPNDPSRMLLGTFPAGIYSSWDGGVTWQETNTNWTWDGAFSLVYHPSDPNIVYSGTYNGVNRSLDGGLSWELWDEGWPDEQWVFSLDFDPRDPNIMYAVSKNGENRGRGQPGIFMGVVMKSENGGETWYEIMNGLPRDNEYYKIIVDPHTPDVLYLASQHDGVFISYDRGSSWRVWNEGLTNIKAGTNGNNVTETMALSPDGVYLYFASSGSGVFRRMTVSASEICGCTP